MRRSEDRPPSGAKSDGQIESMSRGHDSIPPPDHREPLPVARTGGERQGDDVRVLPELARELGRLGRHPLREASRLEHEAAAGENPSTPLILVTGIALILWSIVALVAAIAFVSAYLLT
jgi:hypothetical protein